MEQATLGPIASHRAMQATFAAPVEHTDDFSSMSFAELESLADDLSESSQWSLLDDVRAEIASRVDDAKTALVKEFTEACSSHGLIPWVTDGKLGVWPISTYLLEAMGTEASTAQAVRLLLSPFDRHEIIYALAVEYAREQSEDLLRAGWTE